MIPFVNDCENSPLNHLKFICQAATSIRFDIPNRPWVTGDNVYIRYPETDHVASCSLSLHITGLEITETRTKITSRKECESNESPARAESARDVLPRGPLANCSTLPPFLTASTAAAMPARSWPAIRVWKKIPARRWRCCTINRAAGRNASSRFSPSNMTQAGRSRNRGIELRNGSGSGSVRSHFFVKIAFGIIPCTPRVPSTSCVMEKSTARLESR